jgi:hypothetical protein
MDKFIHDENLKLFRKRLAEATTDEDRMLIRKLMDEEEAKVSRQCASAAERGRGSNRTASENHRSGFNSPKCRFGIKAFHCGHASTGAKAWNSPSR